jgi:hypothetical protein
VREGSQKKIPKEETTIMKSPKSNWTIQPKKMIALALFGVASLMPATKASAQSEQRGQNQTFQAETVCSVNGANHPVDTLGRVWAVNAFGHPYVIGHIISGPNGLIAIRNDGAPFPAECE